MTLKITYKVGNVGFTEVAENIIFKIEKVVAG